MMTIDQHIPGAAPAQAAASSVFASFWSGLRQWVETCAAYYDAAATYEDLARLSNAELERRGLSRDTLARDICSTCERRE